MWQPEVEPTWLYPWARSQLSTYYCSSMFSTSMDWITDINTGYLTFGMYIRWCCSFSGMSGQSCESIHFNFHNITLKIKGLNYDFSYYVLKILQWAEKYKWKSWNPNSKASKWGKWTEIAENKMLSDKLRVHTNIAAAEYSKDYTFNCLNIIWM